MEVLAPTDVAKEKLMASVSGHHGVLQGAWVEAAREATERFSLPTTRVEDWKYTRTGRITAESWRIAAATVAVDPAVYRIPGLQTHEVVFVNGQYRADLSTISDGVWSFSNVVGTPKEYTAQNLFAALNVANATGAAEIRVPKNKAAHLPIHLVHIATQEQALCLPVIRFIAEQGSACEVIESFVNTAGGGTFTHRTLIVEVENNASLEWSKVQMENTHHFLMNDEQVHLSDDTRFNIHTLTVDGHWVRNQLSIALDGKNIETHLNGIYMPREDQFIDNHTKVDHRQPHSQSNELYKGLLGGSSTGVFNGKVYVRQDAQKTNAYQSNANVLLSDSAQMNTKPELEIYADDVKCSHGTTTGQMDENAIFYLRSRGMSVESAQKLLTSAFLNDVLSKVKSEAVRTYVQQQLADRGLMNYEA